MRDLRARILAIEWIQGVATVVYFALFLVSLTSLGYSDLVTGPSHGLAMAAFLPLKSLFSGLVFYGLFTDTGIL
jgi:hypothetical protein